MNTQTRKVKEALKCGDCLKCYPRETIVFVGKAQFCSNCLVKLNERRLARSEKLSSIDLDAYKICKHCGEEKTLAEFPKDSRNKDGVTNKCVECTYPSTAKMSEPILHNVKHLQIHSRHTKENHSREFRAMVKTWCFITVENQKYIRVEYNNRFTDYMVPQSDCYFAIFNAIIDDLNSIKFGEEL